MEPRSLRPRPPHGWWPLALLTLAACTSDTTAPTNRERAEIGWIAPAPGDTLRGTAELLAWVDLDEPVLEVACFVDGRELGVRTAVPWGFTFRPPEPAAGPDLRRLVLEVEARGAATTVRARPVEVLYLRDDPPELTVDLPGRTDWVEIAPGRFLVARAMDREDGSLDGGRIEWRTESGRRFRGDHFPSELLAPGDQTLRLWISDRAANRTERELRVHAFQFAKDDTPLAAARDFQAALSALDLVRLDPLLAPGFRLESCPGAPASARPDPISRAEFVAALGGFAGDPEVGRFIWGGSLRLQGEESRGWALVGWHQLGLLVARGTMEWRMVRLEGDLVLRRGSDGKWQVVIFRERDPGDGPGLPTILRSGVPFPSPA